MEPKLFHIYPSKCTACRNCEIVCSYFHTTGPVPPPSRICAISDEMKREGKNTVIVCLQCDSPACVKACPANALQRDEKTGAIVQLPQRCVRCASCVAACPFGNMHWHSTGRYPVKCDLCHGDPLCVKFCPSGALVYK